MTGSQRAFALTMAAFFGWFTWTESQRIMNGVERFQSTGNPISIQGTSANPGLSFNWGIEEIHAPEVWSRHPGSKNVVVAVIDTGCDIHHPELEGNIWVNPGESGLDEHGRPKENNAIDDDANGFVDDLHGWSFVSNSNDVSDDHGHGTHIAGIIGAKKLNGLSSSGVDPRVSLMILKYYDTESSSEDHLRYTIEAIRYAVKMGADIINYSGGGILRSPDEENALAWAAEQGVLVVAAAGNEGANSDYLHFYPADYPLPNIISVGAIDENEKLLRASNYGSHSVHVAAPGKNIYSTLPGGLHGFMTGTSQATAFVTGVAALMIANNPHFRHNPSAVIQHLMKTASFRSQLYGKVRSNGIVDARLALENPGLQVSETSLPATRRPSAN